MKSQKDVVTEINKINISLELDKELDVKGQAILNTRKRSLLWVIDQFPTEKTLIESENRLKEKKQ